MESKILSVRVYDPSLTKITYNDILITGFGSNFKLCRLQNGKLLLQLQATALSNSYLQSIHKAWDTERVSLPLKVVIQIQEDVILAQPIKNYRVSDFYTERLDTEVPHITYVLSETI